MTEPIAHRNDVHLVGRLSAQVVVRELPSRDLRATWRLVVRRDPPPDDPVVTRPSTDTVECGTWLPEVRREALTWDAGDHVEVRGALRRRFWRAGGAVFSRYEVDATSARRLPRVRPPAGPGTALGGAAVPLRDGASDMPVVLGARDGPAVPKGGTSAPP